LQPRHFP